MRPTVVLTDPDRWLAPMSSRPTGSSVAGDGCDLGYARARERDPAHAGSERPGIAERGADLVADRPVRAGDGLELSDAGNERASGVRAVRPPPAATAAVVAGGRPRPGAGARAGDGVRQGGAGLRALARLRSRVPGVSGSVSLLR